MDMQEGADILVFTAIWSRDWHPAAPEPNATQTCPLLSVAYGCSPGETAELSQRRRDQMGRKI